MQDQVNEKSVSLIIRGGKLSGRLLAKAMLKALAEMKKQNQRLQTPKVYKGKQSVKNLIQQGKGVTNIEITNENIKSFEPIARKYGVDYALKKDATGTPPKWLVFFKAKDADALTVAFKEFSAKSLKKSASKPSILGAISKMKELVKGKDIGKVRNKDKGLEL